MNTIINRTPSNRIPLLAALAALLLAGGLSACTVTVSDPGATEPTGSTPGTSESAPATNGGQFTNGDCDGRDVQISGDATTSVLTGECGDVTITADDATVTVEHAASITVVGTGNTVIGERLVDAVVLQGAGNSYTGGGVGSIEVDSDENNVVLDDAQAVTIRGDGNFVQWSRGVASAQDSGAGNIVIGASGS